MNEYPIRLTIQIVKMCQEAIFEVSIKVTSIQDEIRILFEKIYGERLRIISTNEVVAYFMNSKEIFPLLKLRSIINNFRIEFCGDAVECKAVVSGKDELPFQPETFLEFFNMGEKINNLGGDTVNKFCGFKPIVTIC